MVKILLTFVIVALVTPVQAHHSLSEYDVARKLTLNVTVREFRFVNPHPFVTMEVKIDRGGTQQWRLEMDNRSELAAIGVTAATFKPGDRVVVSGSLARSQPRSLYLLRLDRSADGFFYEQVGASPRIGRASAVDRRPARPRP